MKNISFLSENFQFLEVKFSIYLNRRVFVMDGFKFFTILEDHLSTCVIGVIGRLYSVTVTLRRHFLYFLLNITIRFYP